MDIRLSGDQVRHLSNVTYPTSTAMKCVEPGAVNSLGEFKQWIVIRCVDQAHDKTIRYSAVYPYPFAGKVDFELLAAHAAVHQFRHWPGHWKSFVSAWRDVAHIRDASYGNPTKLICAVSPSCNLDERFLDKLLFTPLHRSLLDALK